MCGTADNQNAIIRAIGPDACLKIDVLAEETSLSRKAVSQACTKLIARGFVDRVEEGCFQLTTEGKLLFENNAILNSAPNRTFSYVRKHANSMRHRIWRAIRVKKKFTVADITFLASRDEKAPRDGVQRYLKLLSQAGYLLDLRKNKAERRYSLVRDTGPEAPIIRKKRTEVYDPNTEETYPCLQR